MYNVTCKIHVNQKKHVNCLLLMRLPVSSTLLVLSFGGLKLYMWTFICLGDQHPNPELFKGQLYNVN